MRRSATQAKPASTRAVAPAGAADVRYAVPAGDSPSIGPANAPVTIIEFLDYQ